MGVPIGRPGRPRQVLMPALAWQLNEVYRQIAGSHKLQQTKFRCVLSWVPGVGCGSRPGAHLAHGPLLLPTGSSPTPGRSELKTQGDSPSHLPHLPLPHPPPPFHPAGREGCMSVMG